MPLLLHATSQPNPANQFVQVSGKDGKSFTLMPHHASHAPLLVHTRTFDAASVPANALTGGLVKITLERNQLRHVQGLALRLKVTNNASGVSEMLAATQWIKEITFRVAGSDVQDRHKLTGDFLQYALMAGRTPAQQRILNQAGNILVRSTYAANEVRDCVIPLVGAWLAAGSFWGGSCDRDIECNIRFNDECQVSGAGTVSLTSATAVVYEARHTHGPGQADLEKLSRSGIHYHGGVDVEEIEYSGTLSAGAENAIDCNNVDGQFLGAFITVRSGSALTAANADVYRALGDATIDFRAAGGERLLGDEPIRLVDYKALESHYFMSELPRNVVYVPFSMAGAAAWASASAAAGYKELRNKAAYFYLTPASAGVKQTNRIDLDANASAGTSQFTVRWTDGQYASETTSVVPYNATAAQLTAALNSLASVRAEGGLDVTGTLDAGASNIDFTWRNPGPKQVEITCSLGDLGTTTAIISAIVLTSTPGSDVSGTNFVRVTLIKASGVYSDARSNKFVSAQ